MAEFLVRNSLNPNKVAKLGVSYNQVTPKGYEGEAIWTLEVATSELDINGNTIRPVYVTNITQRTLDEEIAKAVGIISAQIDWTPLIDDVWSPEVVSVSPSDYETDIDSFVEIEMRDKLPAAGIDLSSIEMTVNDFDVSSELTVTGDPYRYKVKWAPFLRVYEEE
jgi:hypothetical protein